MRRGEAPRAAEAAGFVRPGPRGAGAKRSPEQPDPERSGGARPASADMSNPQ